MKQYIELVKDVLENGIDRDDRTGVGSRSVFGRLMRFDLSEGFPATTTRPAPFRIAFEETMFFLRGETYTKDLEDRNVNIWKGNTSREFLDNRGLTLLPEGDMGKGYGFQWRNFGGNPPGYMPRENSDASYIEGVDQIEELIEGLKSDPNSRRHIVTAWNPLQLDETALPPCHILNQYQVLNGKLNSSFYMRSNDIMYGLPFNIMSYAFLNIAIANLVGLDPGELVYMGGDVHIYMNQIEMAEKQVHRDPMPLPKLEIYKELNTLEDLLSLEHKKDVELINYNYHPDFKDKPKMAV